MNEWDLPGMKNTKPAKCKHTFSQFAKFSSSSKVSLHLTLWVHKDLGKVCICVTTLSTYLQF